MNPNLVYNRLADCELKIKILINRIEMQDKRIAEIEGAAPPKKVVAGGR